MDVFEGVDWEGLGELIEPAVGLIVALLFMAFVRLMRSSRRRTQSPQVEAPSRKVQTPGKPAPKTSGGAAPIEPGDNAAKLSERYSQNPSG